MFFGDNKARDRFRVLTVTSGAFRHLVQATKDQIDQIRLLFLREASALKEYDPRGTILAQWTRGFRVVTRRESIKPEQEDREERWTGPHRDKIRRNAEAFDAIDRQKRAIRSAIFAGVHHKVQRFLRDLITYQRQRSGPEDLAKSLCDLAIDAKQVKEYELQLQLTEQAVEEAPADGWARCQLGDAYLRNRQFDDALVAYQDAVSLGAPRVGRCGRAGVLKALVRFDDSLEEYERAIKVFPTEVVPPCGRAEVLKALGGFDEALEEYQYAIRELPYNRVAHTGLLSVLVLLGRYDEALKHGQVHKTTTFDDWIDHHVCGMALLKTGAV